MEKSNCLVTVKETVKVTGCYLVKVMVIGSTMVIAKLTD